MHPEQHSPNFQTIPYKFSIQAIYTTPINTQIELMKSLKHNIHIIKITHINLGSPNLSIKHTRIRVDLTSELLRVQSARKPLGMKVKRKWQNSWVADDVRTYV